MKAELAQLIALQNADTNIRRLQAEIESIPERRAEIEKEFDQRAFEIRALEERRDNSRHERTRLEAETFEQKQRAERADRNLMSAKKTDEPEVEKLGADMAERFKGFDEQARVQQQELDRARAERERLLNELPKPMSALYKRISSRIRDGVAMAEARNGACTACYMALRPQIMADVRRGTEVITCDNCNRILYYVPANAAHPVGV